MDYDRYVYDIVGMEEGGEGVVVGGYNVVMKEIMDEGGGGIGGKGEGKGKGGSFVGSGMNDEEIGL